MFRQLSNNVRSVQNDVLCRYMCTVQHTKDVQNQKQAYMKNLAKSYDEIVKPPDWDTAKPYSEIPGPKPMPLIGNIWRFLPAVGTYYGMDQITQHQLFNKEYGTIMKLTDLKLRRDLVLLFNPEDIEKAYRYEGVWPLRESLETLFYYRMDLRKDIFQGQGGVLTTQGEEWQHTRSVVNTPMMQPRSAQLYIGSMDDVANDFIQRVDLLRSKHPKGEMPQDFLNEINKWALESICVVGLNKRLGLLHPDLPANSEGQKFINDVLNMFDYMNEFDVKLSVWKWFASPKFKKYMKTLDRITDFEKKHLDEVVKDMEENPTKNKPEAELSILERLMKKDKKIAFAMSFDMLIAGIDTTSRIVSAALYYLSTNLEAQNSLRNELKQILPQRDTKITKETLTNLPYLRAVIKETMRLAPIAIGNLRQSRQDLVLSGYQIPKGSDIIMAHMMLCRKPENFSRPDEFIPERWLRDGDNEFMNKSLNPFVYMPFGFGPRSCVGRRLANLEIEVILSKVIRNFEITWPNDPMVWTMSILYGVGSPLKFQVKKLQD